MIVKTGVSWLSHVKENTAVYFIWQALPGKAVQSLGKPRSVKIDSGFQLHLSLAPESKSEPKAVLFCLQRQLRVIIVLNPLAINRNVSQVRLFLTKKGWWGGGGKS